MAQRWLSEYRWVVGRKNENVRAAIRRAGSPSKCRRTFSLRREQVAIVGSRNGGVGKLDRRDKHE
jgi:hypothetical protein